MPGSDRVAATRAPVVPSPYGQGRAATRASSAGAVSACAARRARSASSSQVSPASTADPFSTPSHRGVDRRSTTTGTPKNAASSWIPPESVTATRQPASAPSIPSYGSGPHIVTLSSLDSRAPRPDESSRRAVRGCTGNRTGPTWTDSASTSATSRASRVGSSTFVGRCAVTSTPVRRSGGTGARPRSRSASTTGLPTTNTRSAGTPSAASSAADRAVGAK